MKYANGKKYCQIRDTEDLRIWARHVRLAGADYSWHLQTLGFNTSIIDIRAVKAPLIGILFDTL